MLSHWFLTSVLVAVFFGVASAQTPSTTRLFVPLVVDTTDPDGPTVQAFVLVDSATGQDIRTLQDGDEIDLEDYSEITIRVQTEPATVGSVEFLLDGSPTYPDGTPRHENNAPYALDGDTEGRFNPWRAPIGAHTITATAYARANASGAVGPARSIRISIWRGRRGRRTATPTATATAISGAEPTNTPTATPTNTPTNTPIPGSAPTATPTTTPTVTPTSPPAPTPGGPVPALVFVSRQIPPNGSIYWDVPNDMPGVGPYSRFRVASPGKLLVREANGQIRVLIDGSQPSAATLNLIDVNAPDVSYDGRTIVFAGLPQGNYSRGPLNNPGAWRIYAIGADGSGLRPITRSDQNLDYSQFGILTGAFQAYDDTDPTWLPDGRIVFSSTRWPTAAQYAGARGSNLYVVNADGSNLHRITAERNGADRPMVDPVTGKIVYMRWWRNQRFAATTMDTVADPNGGYIRKDGLTADRNNQVGGSDFLWRNAWFAAEINPDGTSLAQWGGVHHALDTNLIYGGDFTPNGVLIANYFPQTHLAEGAGFGGIRRFQRGPGTSQSIIGVTTQTLDFAHPSNPTSYGVYNGPYAGEPAVLPDGRIVISWAKDYYQDYGLYLINADGTGLTLLYDGSGTTELRAQVLASRTLPPRIPDRITQVASLLPPREGEAYDQDGTFVFDALNVYFNGPVDTTDTSAPPVGSASRIRFFTDFTRRNGSYPNLDWPILLGERTIAPDGSVREPNAPANLPLFEQIRSSDGSVPLTPGVSRAGAAHVAGMNFGRPGDVQRCVGCHSGHTMIPVPATDEAAKWTNLAPGAQVRVSSTRDANQNRGLIDRRVMKGEIWRYWVSASGQTQNQWVELVFPVPVTVRTVRLYNPRTGGEANSSIQVSGATVRLYSDAGATQQVASATAGQLTVTGTDVAFADVRARVVRVEITGVSGTFYGAQVAGLAEIEVIARGEAP